MRPPVGAGFFHRPLHPADRIEIDPKLVRQMAARPDRRGLRVKRHAHPLAFEILRGADVGLRVDEDVAMTKDARGKYWQGDERTVATSHQADEFRGGKLRHVEFPSAHHAIKDLAAGRKRDGVEIDAFRDHLACANGLHPVVAAAGEGQAEARHRFSHSGCGGAPTD